MHNRLSFDLGETGEQSICTVLQIAVQKYVVNPIKLNAFEEVDEKVIILLKKLEAKQRFNAVAITKL